MNAAPPVTVTPSGSSNPMPVSSTPAAEPAESRDVFVRRIVRVPPENDMSTEPESADGSDTLDESNKISSTVIGPAMAAGAKPADNTNARRERRSIVSEPFSRCTNLSLNETPLLSARRRPEWPNLIDSQKVSDLQGDRHICTRKGSQVVSSCGDEWRAAGGVRARMTHTSARGSQARPR